MSGKSIPINKKDIMNYLNIQNNFLIVYPQKNDIKEIINSLINYIYDNDCKKMSVDISMLNMIDAIKTGTICSTYHFSKYPNGSLEWIVKDIETRNSLKTLALKTIKTSIKQPIIKNFYPIKQQKIAILR